MNLPILSTPISKKADVHVLIKALKQKGFYLYQRPFELNIVGVRDSSIIADKFDDNIFLFWRDDKKKWQFRKYQATTDPGVLYLKSGFNGTGYTSILAEGQYKDAYAIGLHQGKYKALVQVAPVTALLDGDKNNLLDFKSKKTKTGLFGINIHRAKEKGTTEQVYAFSAACQVLANADNFKELINLAEKHKKLYGNKFTYTLIDEKAATRAQLKIRLVMCLLIALVLVGIYFLYKKGYLQQGVAMIRKQAKGLVNA